MRIGAPLNFAGTADDRAGWEAVASKVEYAVGALRDG
jgi:hypothetical protein